MALHKHSHLWPVLVAHATFERRDSYPTAKRAPCTRHTHNAAGVDGTPLVKGCGQLHVDPHDKHLDRRVVRASGREKAPGACMPGAHVPLHSHEPAESAWAAPVTVSKVEASRRFLGDATAPLTPTHYADWVLRVMMTNR